MKKYILLIYLLLSIPLLSGCALYDSMNGWQKFGLIFGIVYGVAVWIANIALCCSLATNKNRDAGVWGFLAFFFGILITLILASLDEVVDMDEKPHYDWSDDFKKKPYDVHKNEPKNS